MISICLLTVLLGHINSIISGRQEKVNCWIPWPFQSTLNLEYMLLVMSFNRENSQENNNSWIQE